MASRAMSLVAHGRARHSGSHAVALAKVGARRRNARRWHRPKSWLTRGRFRWPSDPAWRIPHRSFTANCQRTPRRNKSCEVLNWLDLIPDHASW